MADEDHYGHGKGEGERDEPDDIEDGDVTRTDSKERGEREADGAAEYHG